MKSRITVGIPTHKRPKLLKRAINSIIKNKLINIEIIISIDGIDKTQNDYKKIQNFYSNYKNIKFIYHKNNIGSLNNFLFLRNICKTEFFMWLADDDETSPKLILELYKILEKNKEAVTAVPFWELYKSKENKKIIRPSYFEDRLVISRIFKYCYDPDDVFFYGLHRSDNIKKCSFKNYWWPNKNALSNWAYVFQMDLIIQGKIIFLNNNKLTWKNHDYGIKYYKRSSVEFFFKQLSTIIRKFNIYFLYLEKFIKWKKIHYIFIFILPFFIFFLRDIILKEPVIKKIKF